jgi:hypothetical protein
VITSTKENHAASDISTADEDSGSDKELISGSAQTHSVFNLAELASIMDDVYAFFNPVFSIPFGFIDHIGSPIPSI